MTKRLYADTNVVDRLHREWEIEAFNRLSDRLDCNLAIGHHVLAELASGLLYSDHAQVTRQIFEFLVDVDRLEILATLEELLEAEFQAARTGETAYLRLDLDQEVLIRQALVSLVEGDVDEVRQFVSLGSLDDSGVQPQMVSAHAHLAVEMLHDDPSMRQQIKTFHAFRERVAPTAESMLLELSAQRQLNIEAGTVRTIVGHPQRYPGLNTWLNVQWYLAFILAVHEDMPSEEKIADFRHLMESAHCDLLVTEDEELLRRAGDVCPFKPAMAWKVCAEALQQGAWPASTLALP